MNKEKRLKIILIVVASLLVIAIGVIIFLLVKNNDNKKEVKDNDKKVEQVVDNEVDIKIDNDEEWNALGEKQKYFQLNSEHLKREKVMELFYDYTYDNEFIDTFFMISNGFFNGASKENIVNILNTALNELPDNATARDVFDELSKFAITYSDIKDQWVNGEGTPVKQSVDNNTQVESKYISERFGFKVGDVLDASSNIDSDKFTYAGKDIWVNSSGIKFKAEEKGNSFQFVCIEQPSNQVASNNNSNNNNNNSNSTNKTSNKIVGRTTPIYLDPNKKYHRDPDNPYCEEAFICEACGGLIFDSPGSGCLCDIDLTPRVDPSGCEVGSAGWHKYWDGKTVKEHNEQGGICSFMIIYKDKMYTYPDSYVIGSYGVVREGWQIGEEKDLMGKY